MTRFSANKQNRFLKVCLYLIMLLWQRDTRQPNYQKTEVCVINLLAAIFGDHRIRGFREKVNETQVLKTVFSHLKELIESAIEVVNTPDSEGWPPSLYKAIEQGKIDCATFLIKKKGATDC